MIRLVASTPKASAAHNQVNADDGVVTVTGKAGSHKSAGVIPVIAGRVEGVTGVINQVVVGIDWMW